MSPVTGVRALEERNVWEVEFLFFVSSDRNSRFFTVRNGLDETGNKFRSDVTLLTPRIEVVTSHTRAGDKEMTFSTKAYEINEKCALAFIGAVSHDTVIRHRTVISLSKSHVVASYVKWKELYSFKLREV